MTGTTLRYVLAAVAGIYLAAAPFFYYRYRAHHAACPCHRVQLPRSAETPTL